METMPLRLGTNGNSFRLAGSAAGFGPPPIALTHQAERRSSTDRLPVAVTAPTGQPSELRRSSSPSSIAPRAAVPEQEPPGLRAVGLSLEVGAAERPASACVDDVGLRPTIRAGQVEVSEPVRFDGGIARPQPHVVGHSGARPNARRRDTGEQRLRAERGGRGDSDSGSRVSPPLKRNTLASRIRSKATSPSDSEVSRSAQTRTARS